MYKSEKKVWKYPLLLQDYQVVEMPFGAKILSFQLQNSVPTIWCLVEPTQEKVIRRFRMVGTGHKIEEGGLQYIGTIQITDINLIYHLFEF